MAQEHTRVFLIRHGATVLTVEDRFAGATDVQLSDEGRRQARRLALRLQEVPINAVYASPMGRTIETAQILAAPHHLQVEQRDGLREISHGHWEQMTREEVDKKYPEEAREWDKDPYTFAPAGWRERTGGDGARVADADRTGAGEPTRKYLGRFPQGDDPAAAQFAARV